VWPGKLRNVASAAILIPILAGCGSSGTAAPSASCGTKATESCTPRVGPDGSVRVDTLTWHVRKTFQTPLLPGATSAENKTAPEGDTFLVAFLKVTNGKTDPVTPTRELVKLKVGPRTYTQIVTYATLWEAKPLQPNTPADLAAAFRVPAGELAHHPELQFNELGFGQTHGYIALPQPIPSESSTSESSTTSTQAGPSQSETAPVLTVGSGTGTGATNCGGELYGTSDTSCPFAREVLVAFQRRYAVLHAPPARIAAYSPTTHVAYHLNCVLIEGGKSVECATGTAIVSFPATHGQRPPRHKAPAVEGGSATPSVNSPEGQRILKEDPECQRHPPPPGYQGPVQC
jgi:hypothetical protein